MASKLYKLMCEFDFGQDYLIFEREDIALKWLETAWEEDEAGSFQEGKDLNMFYVESMDLLGEEDVY